MAKGDGPCPVKDLENLLQQTLGLQLRVQHAVWRHLTNPGDNFGSLILAVDVTVTRDCNPEILNLVIKLPPTSDYFLELFNSPLTFRKELTFYQKLAPAFLNIQLESGIKFDQLIRLVSKFYGGRLGLEDPDKFDSQAAIVLENLNSSGFTTQDRLLGLDGKHTKLAVEELAKLHAIVIGLKIKNPGFFEKIVMPALVHPTNDTTRQCIVEMVKKAHEAIKNLPEADPYLEDVDKTLTFDYEVDPRKIKPEEPWGTMVHNDFWVNNMMFSYNENNEPVGLKMVDFQLGFYDSGVKDLVFFLMTSTKKEVLDDHFDEMLELYWKAFIDCLVTLKVDTGMFTREKFDEQLRKLAPTKFGHCIMMIQVITAPRGGSEIGDGDEFLNMAGGKLFEDKLMHTLQFFNKKGWLSQ